MSKRVFDIIASALGLLFLSPLFLLVGLLIKLDSKGPVFYRGTRVGKDGKPFRMLKFRTMLESLGSWGPQLSANGDPRVTTLGRILRRLKINELPQLINVLKGEMSFVGPRPEVEKFVRLYHGEQRKVLSVRPGIIGPSQILFRNEEELFPRGYDPERFYMEQILPDKLRIDLGYVGQASLLTDLKYLILGLKATVLGALSKRFLVDNKVQVALFFMDLFMACISYMGASMLRFEGNLPGTQISDIAFVLPILLLVRAGCQVLMGLYQILIRHFSIPALVTIIKSTTLGSLVTVVLLSFSGHRSFSRAVFLMDWFILIFLMVGIRLAGRVLRDKYYSRKELSKGKVFIYGAGKLGELALRQVSSIKGLNYEVIGFIDDKQKKRHKQVLGKKVLGDRYDLEALSKIYGVRDIILAMENIDPMRLRQILTHCRKAGLRCKLFPSIGQATTNSQLGSGPRALGIYDLVETPEVPVDLETIQDFYSGKKVLIIGAGGALGSEIARQIVRCNPAQLLLVDRNESDLTEICYEAQTYFPKERIVPMLLEFEKEREKMGDIIASFQPQVIFHMAMRKYRALIAPPPEQVIENNIFGTCNLARVAKEHGAELFFMASTYNGLGTESIMDKTIRLAELYLQALAGEGKTRFMTMRFCNILEAQGGMISVIQKQIRNNGKVFLPHPESRGYFLSAEKAIQIMLQASVKRNTGGIYLCYPGKPVRVMDIAADLAFMAGMQLGEDIEIVFDGQEWPEEQEIEELDRLDWVDTGDGLRQQMTDRNGCSLDELDETLGELQRLADSGDIPLLIAKLPDLRWTHGVKGLV